MTLTAPWYDSTALQALGVILVTLVGIAATIWVAQNVRLPKRRLYYGMSAITPLLTAPPGTKDDLELRHKDTVLAEPHVLRLRIFLRGRQDISSDDYDSGKPLNIDVGSTIVEILDVTSQPHTSPVPKVEPEGTAIKVGPSLIHRGQSITISLLSDGRHAAINCINSLKDVAVHQERPGDTELHILLFGPHNLWVGGVLGSLAAFTVAQFSPHPLGWLPFLISVPLLLISLIGMIWTFAVLFKRSRENERKIH